MIVHDYIFNFFYVECIDNNKRSTCKNFQKFGCFYFVIEIGIPFVYFCQSLFQNNRPILFFNRVEIDKFYLFFLDRKLVINDHCLKLANILVEKYRWINLHFFLFGHCLDVILEYFFNLWWEFFVNVHHNIFNSVVFWGEACLHCLNEVAIFAFSHFFWKINHLKFD